jgi:hypothetical protein
VHWLAKQLLFEFWRIARISQSHGGSREVVHGDILYSKRNDTFWEETLVPLDEYR